MSKRIYNTSKVSNIIGLQGEIKYDKIDVFVDWSNKDNLWGIVYYTEYKKNKKIIKRDIKKFTNYSEMITFVRSNFNGYELNHQVDYHYRHIFMHYVDYLNIDYYLHEGKPHLNYLDLNYKEYTNGNFHIKKIRLPKEYEDMLVKIIKINQKTDNNKYGNIVNTIDVYKNDKNNRDFGLSIDEKIKKRVDELRKESKARRKEVHIKNLKLSMAVVSLGVLLTSGITLVKESNVDKKDVITQENISISLRDANILLNKDKFGIIIDNLMNSDYENVNIDDLNFVISAIKEIENSNYDNNSSTTKFNYIDYFSYKIFENNKDMLSIDEVKNVLVKIEKLYNNCFNYIDGNVFINQSEVNNYINYVASLTFMYDIFVDIRNSNQVPMDNQSITSKYASKKDITTYNNYPAILKYIILNQLKSIISHSEYKVVERPSYYFNGLDKDDLMNEVSKRIDIILDGLKKECKNTFKSV